MCSSVTFGIHHVTGILYGGICPEASALTVQIQHEGVPHSFTLFGSEPARIARELAAAATQAAEAWEREYDARENANPEPRPLTFSEELTREKDEDRACHDPIGWD